MRDPTALLPLTPAMFEVLLSLTDGDLHGYAILKDVADRTGGRVTLSTGTLYGIIKRLLADGLAVESRRRPPAPDDDSRRRYYHITRFGLDVARAELARIRSMLDSARLAGLARKTTT